MYVIVYLNDARVIGPFNSEADAEHWAKKIPNRLFLSDAEYQHADTNADFFITKFEFLNGGE